MRTVLSMILIFGGGLLFSLIQMACGWTDDDKDTQAWAQRVLYGIGELIENLGILMAIVVVLFVLKLLVGPYLEGVEFTID